MTEEQLKQLLDLIAELKRTVEEQKNTTGAEFAEYQKKIDELEGKINDLQADANSLGGRGNFSKPQSLGQRFTKSEKFKTASKSLTGVAETFEAGDPILSTDENGNTIVDSTDVTSYLPKKRKRLRDLFTKRRVSTGNVNYVRVTGYVNRAKRIAQGDTIPYSELKFEADSKALGRTSHMIPIHKDTYSDPSAVASIVDVELRYGVEVASDEDIASIILADSAVQTYDPTTEGVVGDTYIDSILRAKTKVEVTDYVADYLIINPHDKTTIDLTKDDNGNYILGPATNATQKEVWDLEIVVNNKVPQGKFIIVASQAAVYAYNGEYELEIATQHGENFAKDMYVLKGAERDKFVVTTPEAIVIGEFESSEETEPVEPTEPGDV